MVMLQFLIINMVDFGLQVNDILRKGEGNDKVREEDNLIGKFKSVGKFDNVRIVYGIVRMSGIWDRFFIFLFWFDLDKDGKVLIVYQKEKVRVWVSVWSQFQ